MGPAVAGGRQPRPPRLAKARAAGRADFRHYRRSVRGGPGAGGDLF